METLIKYKRPIKIVAACLIGLLLLLYIVGVLDNCNFRRGIEKDKVEVNALTNQANAIDSNISNINAQQFEIEVGVNSMVKEKDKIRKEKVNAAINTNKSMGNLANVRTGNYSNTSTVNAYESLCLAYPESELCTR